MGGAGRLSTRTQLNCHSPKEENPTPLPEKPPRSSTWNQNQGSDYNFGVACCRYVFQYVSIRWWVCYVRHCHAPLNLPPTVPHRHTHVHRGCEWVCVCGDFVLSTLQLFYWCCKFLVIELNFYTVAIVFVLCWLRRKGGQTDRRTDGHKPIDCLRYFFQFELL